MTIERSGRGLYPKTSLFPGGHERIAEMTGKNVEICATFRRHGYKADPTEPQAALSARGRKQMTDIARSSPIRKDGRFVRSSPRGRALETAEIILADAEKRGLAGGNGVNRRHLGHIRVRHELSPAGGKTFDREWNRIYRAHLPENYKELDFEHQQEASWQADNAAYEWWFAQGASASDPRIPSPHAFAAELAVLVSRVIQSPEKLWNGSSLDEEFISHLSRVETILKEILLRKVKDTQTGEETIVRGFETLKDIGGAMRPGEGWKLLVKTDDNRGKTVRVNLRGLDYAIDLDRLEELRQEGIQIARARREGSSLLQIGEGVTAQKQELKRIREGREKPAQ